MNAVLICTFNDFVKPIFQSEMIIQRTEWIDLYKKLVITWTLLIADNVKTINTGLNIHFAVKKNNLPLRQISSVCVLLCH